MTGRSRWKRRPIVAPLPSEAAAESASGCSEATRRTGWARGSREPSLRRNTRHGRGDPVATPGPSSPGQSLEWQEFRHRRGSIDAAPASNRVATGWRRRALARIEAKYGHESQAELEEAITREASEEAEEGFSDYVSETDCEPDGGVIDTSLAAQDFHCLAVTTKKQRPGRGRRVPDLPYRLRLSAEHVAAQARERSEKRRHQGGQGAGAPMK